VQVIGDLYRQRVTVSRHLKALTDAAPTLTPTPTPPVPATAAQDRARPRLPQHQQHQHQQHQQHQQHPKRERQQLCRQWLWQRM